MTAFNISVKGATGYIASDTALYEVDATVVDFQRKIHVVGDLPMALVCRGHIEAGPAIAAWINEEFVDFDDFLAGGEEFLRDLYDENRDDFDVAGNDNVDIGIVGFSSRLGRAVGITFSSQDATGIGGPAPFVFAKDEISLFPVLTIPELRAAGLFGTTGIVVTGEPLLVAAMELQRRKPVLFNGAQRHIVGGSIEIATVTRDGVSIRAVKDWQDRVDERINPTSQEVVAIAGMNRQQRRALERAQRKAA